MLGIRGSSRLIQMYSDGVMKGVALGFFRNNIGIQQNTLELCVKTFLFSELYVVERKIDFLSTTPELSLVEKLKTEYVIVLCFICFTLITKLI